MAHRRHPGRSKTHVEVQRVYASQGRAGQGRANQEHAVDDVYVRVNSIGTTGERPFVLIPGIGVSSTYFERLAPNLNEFGPVYALDLPGFGGVPHPDTAMSIRHYADLVGLVIDELGLVDPIVVGHSMGSQIVSDLASRRSDLSSLVLIGPVVNPAERRLLTQAKHFLRAALREPGTVKVLAVSAYMFCGFKWFSRVLPQMMTYRIEDALPQITAHTLVIRGEFDGVAPRDWVKRVGELLPSSRLWEMPGAAHSVMYAHAEEVARLCVEHAHQTVADGDESNELHIAEVSEDADRETPLTLADAAQSIGGRLTEAVGVITDNDDLVEQGKTTHAEAMDAAQRKAQSGD
jgi:pimeloyl-ACP methyl ester carboxylesterase